MYIITDYFRDYLLYILFFISSPLRDYCCVNFELTVFSDNPIKTLQLTSALQSILVSFSSLFLVLQLTTPLFQSTLTPFIITLFAAAEPQAG